MPEGNELAELFNRANLLVGAAMSLVAKSGLRPEVLENYDVSDGLMIKDLPDLAVVESLASFIKMSARILDGESLGPDTPVIGPSKSIRDFAG